MLCKPQIYRHSFYNYRQHDRNITTTLFLTAASLLVLYWQENRKAHKQEVLWEDLPEQYPVFVSEHHMLMQRLQSQNLAYLYLADAATIVKVLLSDFTFMLAIML
mmetsp:Transcript_16922/g.22770  ORF Transcript_16922/g.22770 Transcript_16922/m.22770 type:complete len:105 (+) Transcript_16922:213-527(+)